MKEKESQTSPEDVKPKVEEAIPKVEDQATPDVKPKVEEATPKVEAQTTPDVKPKVEEGIPEAETEDKSESRVRDVFRMYPNATEVFGAGKYFFLQKRDAVNYCKSENIDTETIKKYEK